MKTLLLLFCLLSIGRNPLVGNWSDGAVNIALCDNGTAMLETETEAFRGQWKAEGSTLTLGMTGGTKAHIEGLWSPYDTELEFRCVIVGDTLVLYQTEGDVHVGTRWFWEVEK